MDTLAAQLAKIAYLDHAKASAMVDNLGLSLDAWFDRLGTTGFLAGDRDNFFLVFRGTNELQDWNYNMSATFIHTHLGRVHAGFYQAFARVWDRIREIMVAHRNGRRLYITGHSLGGALAVLASVACRSAGHMVSGLITFGQPRVGDKIFAGTLPKPYHRYCNNNDVVPRVPPWWTGFRHGGQEIYITSDGEIDSQGRTRRIWDLLRGRVRNHFRGGTDGINDHNMDNYVDAVCRSNNHLT